MHKGQRKLFSHLTHHKVKITKGYMLKSNGRYHEKGVDVSLALDVAIGAYENTYDHCYLISSDTDLIPAIKLAQKKNKSITYVGFTDSTSRAMIYNCDKRKIITKDNLSQFTN